MGRGRAKAKQTKVARDLKYSSPQTDFGQLQKELAGDPVGRTAYDDDDADASSWSVPDDDWRR